MIVGVPKEIMDHEFRVGMTPQGVRELVHDGHEVLVEAGAGLGSGFTDEDYQRAGASLRAEVGDLYREAALIVKVKEPQPQEFDLLRPGQILFCFLHLAAHKQLAETFLARETIAVAYETVEVEGGAAAAGPHERSGRAPGPPKSALTTWRR